MNRWLHRYVELHRADGPQDKLWRVIQAVTLGGVLLLLGVGAAMFSINAVLTDKRELDTELGLLVGNLQRYERLLVDMETGQRGYLLTRDRQYLEPYRRGLEEYPDASAAIEAEVASHTASRAAFVLIRSQARSKMDELARSLEIDLASGPEVSLAFVRTNTGKSLMEQLRAGMENLRRQTIERVAANRDEIDSLSFQRGAAMAALLLLALLAGLASLWLMGRFAKSVQQAEQERRRAEVATAANREKSTFLANMSHEIRTPMNAIFGFAQLLGDLVKNPRELFYARAIIQSGQVLLDLINDILDMSKIEAGRLELAPESVSLRELLRSCETLFAHMAAEKGLTLGFEIGPNVPDAVRADPLRLRQIVINLVGNALKYTPQGSVAVLLTAQPAVPPREGYAQLTLQVTDSGVGIPNDKIAHIFEPFTQVGVTTSGASGTGLGLSIVKKLTGLMGGRVSVDSVQGHGSRFVVTLPNVPAASVSPLRGERVRRPLSQLPPLKILAVDDVELNRRLIEGIFINTHHQVLTATDGARGVALAAQAKPEVIFMDIRMPGMDGITAVKVIRGNPELASCKVIAATASSMLSEEDEQRRLFDGYLRKPLTREAIEDQLFALFGDMNAPAAVALAEAAPALTAEEAGAWAARTTLLGPALSAARATLSSDAIRELVAAFDGLPETPGLLPLHRLKEDIAMAAAVFDITGLERLLATLDDTSTRLGTGAAGRGADLGSPIEPTVG